MNKKVSPLLKVVLTVLAGAVVYFALTPSKQENLPSATAKIKDQEVSLEIADTPEKRRVGLMNRKSLYYDKGMIFIFPTSSKYAFWMKNTLIPLDMIWLDSEYKIVHIEKDVPPCNEKAAFTCPLYQTPVDAQYVIELNAGWSESNGLAIGDVFTVSY